MAEHTLKTWPNAFDAVASGQKRFEWRRDDRGFEVGDVLVLQKWDPQGSRWSGMGEYITTGTLYDRRIVEIRYRVTYILRGMFGVPDGYCVMSLEVEP